MLKNFEQIIIVYALLYTHSVSGADAASGKYLQLVTSIHDEGDGLILCEQQ